MENSMKKKAQLTFTLWLTVVLGAPVHAGRDGIGRGLAGLLVIVVRFRLVRHRARDAARAAQTDRTFFHR